MTYEKSCGAILFTREQQKGENSDIKYVLIQNRGGCYGFPKGHMEAGETEEETALREIYEEVGIRPQLLTAFREMDEHPIPNKPNVIKQVVYFLGEYSGQTIRPQKEELTEASLLSFDEAFALLQFDGIRTIFRKANAWITQANGKKP